MIKKTIVWHPGIVTGPRAHVIRALYCIVYMEY